MMSRTKTLIAVVNDDQAYIDFVRELLVEEGYQTIACVGEHAAHAMVRREKPDFIILDMRLEHPDAGWQILQLIRLDPATKEIPVLVCSADAKFLREKEQQLRAQRCDILEKPFDLDMLLEKIIAAVGQGLRHDRQGGE
jgi:CheY-like chemotaxis protein